MHPSVHARDTPAKPALIMSPSGETVSYAELDERSNRGAQLFRALGLKSGEVIALCLENSAIFLEIAWAAQRSGLYFVCVSTKLTTDELAFILADSGARLFITSTALDPMPSAIAERQLPLTLFSADGAIPGFRDFRAERAAMPAEPIADEQAGADMLYSSGTTGRPKGIKPRVTTAEPIDAPDGVATFAALLYGASPESIYLCPAPLYHAAPLRWSMAMMRLGATLVVMEHFSPEAALAAIERHRVTIAQFVPTHFVRMLKLPDAARTRSDLSSLRTVVHAAAPCPVPIKRAMIDWLGPIVHEYYSGSEGNGATFINSAEWLAHPGSVGRPLTTQVHICGEDGAELPARAEGAVYFSGGADFEYHNDPIKTGEARNALGWTTLGDIGWVDEEGFLYLTDRKSFMIITGGVNVYPQELENLLVTHPRVADVAVIGAPDEEMGERIVAIVEPLDWADAGDALCAELTAFARASLSHLKCPRQIDFIEQLPRHATGKLYKRLLRDRYWMKG